MNVILRNNLKKAYKKFKLDDSVNVGRVINKHVQDIHQEKKKENPDQTILNELIEKISELSKQIRFSKEFPDFPSFKEYVISNKLSISELSF